MSAGETTVKLREMLRARYSQNGIGNYAEWVQIHEAPLGNEERQRRFCDMIAVGVWKKTKNRVIGHEIKASRSDWLKEVDEPEKSEAFSQYCHRWYVVAAPGIVKLEELKPEWGLMEATKSFGSLRIKKQPKDHEPLPLPISMIAAWMRRVTEGPDMEEINRIVTRRVAEREESRRSIAESKLKRAEQRCQELNEVITNFEQASGIRIGSWGGNEKDIKAIKLVSRNTPDELIERFKSIQSHAAVLLDTSSSITEALVSLEAQEAV